jgi:molybdenum cofactor cytidylyltransferase
MPWVRAETLATLRRAMEAAADDAIIVPEHEGRPGHPVGFGAAHLGALAALTGDSGARDVVRGAGDRVRRVPVDDPGVLADLDSPPLPG